MASLNRRFAFVVASAAIISLVLANPSARPANDEFQDSLAKAQKFVNSAQYDEALKELHRDEKQATGVQIYYVEWNLARTYAGLGDIKKAAESCDRAIAGAPDDSAKARAHTLKGRIYTGDQSNKKELAMGEAEFRAALQLVPSFATAHFNLGLTLLRENRNSDGIAELQAYLDVAPNGEDAVRARAIIANPERARAHFMPDFSFTTMQGQQVSSESFRGKVMLLEFWASWCPPCQEAAPGLAELYREHAKDRFAFISISVDSDGDAWRRFVEKHHMEWIQSRDPQHDVVRLFFGEGRRFGIPAYFVIDGDGSVRSVRDDWSPSMQGFLNDDINKALKSLPPVPSASAENH
jgi:peroxiredoxin